MTFWQDLTQDWAVNRNNLKIQLMLVLFRACARCWRSGRWGRFLGLPLFVGYRVGVEWILGIELPWKIQVGPRLRIYHGMALVVHPATVIGADCILRHGTTLGNRHAGGGAPQLGNAVDVGAQAMLLGSITVGECAVIGAGAVVLQDVPPGGVMVGNPARLVREPDNPSPKSRPSDD